jgi:putative ABC transport system permease protein
MLPLKSLEIIRLGLRSLKQHAMRSLLTMLGILFGVCSVIAMLAIGEGTSRETQRQFLELGAANILISSVKPPETGTTSSGSRATEYGLTHADAERIKSILLHVEVVVPQRRIALIARRFHYSMRADVVGTVPWAAGLVNARVKKGRFLTITDERRSINYCVLGSNVARRLFPLEDPVGKTVQLGSSYFPIVGVMEPRGGAAKKKDGNKTDTNSEIYIPLSAARHRFGETIFKFESGSRSAEKVELHEIIVRCESVDQVMETSRAVQAILDRNHPKQDVQMTVPLEQIEAARKAGDRFKIMLGAIAAISLVVGGIGIMNIMLASVTERTREIGIRRALGAKKRDITLQFLVETVVISTIGGLLGVGAGIVLPELITKFTGQQTVVTAWSLGVSVIISLAVGLVFGIYPAWRAAQLDPIEALRHE